MKYLYEFIGTFFLVFTIGMTGIHPGASAIMAPLAIGSILAVMIFAGGHVSGAHYNPAVSFSIFLRGNFPLKDLLNYWMVQLSAALAASYLALYLVGMPESPPLMLSPMKAFLAECLFSFALCFVVLNVAVAKSTSGNSFYGFAIGFTVLAGAYAVGPISGGAFNPAVALGICAMNLISWSNIWLFFAAHLLGGSCAALVFNAAHKEKEVKEKEIPNVEMKKNLKKQGIKGK